MPANPAFAAISNKTANTSTRAAAAPRKGRSKWASRAACGVGIMFDCIIF